MPDLRIGGGDFFARGLDGISHMSVTEARGLPDPHELAPADQAQRPQLDQLLALPNIESFLEDSLRPELDDPDLLTPTRFHEVQTAVQTQIEARAEALRASDPEGAKVLARAGRLLADELNLRELLQMYRSSLYQG